MNPDGRPSSTKTVHRLKRADQIHLLSNSEPMVPSQLFQRLRLERTSGPEQIKTAAHSEGGKQKAGAGEGRIEGIGQELSTVESGGPSERIASGPKVRG